jgi:hypothetical protein
MDHAITIRQATEQDRAAIARLAALDEGAAPRGDALLALVDGQLMAALPVDGGEGVADPFHPTADLLALLRVRARQGDTRATGVRTPLLRLTRA